MPISLETEGGDVFRLVVHGLLRRAELRACEEQLAGAMQPDRAVRLLVVLKDFEGWEPNAAWNDLAFYARYGDRVERIAVVGPPRWESDVRMFVLADLRQAPVEFFPVAPGATENARAWLTA